MNFRNLPLILAIVDSIGEQNRNIFRMSLYKLKGLIRINLVNSFNDHFGVIFESENLMFDSFELLLDM